MLEVNVSWWLEVDVSVVARVSAAAYQQPSQQVLPVRKQSE